MEDGVCEPRPHQRPALRPASAQVRAGKEKRM